MAYPESYQETAMLTLKNGSVKNNFALITESIEINSGEKQIEGLVTLSGGRITKWTPEGDTEFTAKIIPVGVGKTTDTTADGFWQYFQAGTDDTMPQSTPNSRSRNVYSVAIMFASTYPADAFTSTATSIAAYRVVLKNAYITKFTKSGNTSDGFMADLAIKCVPFDKNGSSNITEESTDGTGALPNLA